MIVLVFLILVLAAPAEAYTDPGTGSLIWQLIAAGFVGSLFYLRKIVSWFKPKKPRNGNGE